MTTMTFPTTTTTGTTSGTKVDSKKRRKRAALSSQPLFDLLVKSSTGDSPLTPLTSSSSSASTSTTSTASQSPLLSPSLTPRRSLTTTSSTSTTTYLTSYITIQFELPKLQLESDNPEEATLNEIEETSFEQEGYYYYCESKKGKFTPHGRVGKRNKEREKAMMRDSRIRTPGKIISFSPTYYPPSSSTSSSSWSTSSKSKTSYSSSTQADSITAPAPTPTSSSTSTSSFNSTQYERELRQSSESQGLGLSFSQLLDLSNRELTPEDYELLLLLDNSIPKKTIQVDNIDSLDESTVMSGRTVKGTAVTDVCTICMGDFEEGEVVKHLHRCPHFFHKDCLVPWLSGHSTQCPLCKTDVF